MVVGVQDGVVIEAHDRDAVLVADIGTLVDKARRDGVPVVWVQHSSEHLVRGSDPWKYVPEPTQTEDLTAWGAPPPAHVIAHTNLYSGEQAAPGRTAVVTGTVDVSFGR